MPTGTFYTLPCSIADIQAEFAYRRNFDLYIGSLLKYGHRTKYYKLPVKERNSFLLKNEEFIVKEYRSFFISDDDALTKAFQTFLMAKEFNGLLNED